MWDTLKMPRDGAEQVRETIVIDHFSASESIAGANEFTLPPNIRRLKPRTRTAKTAKR